MSYLADREPSIAGFLDVLQEQKLASTEAIQNKPPRWPSFTTDGLKNTTSSIIYVKDNIRGRVSSSISSTLPSWLIVHHELDFSTWILGTWIFWEAGSSLHDTPQSIVRGTNNITLQVPKLPLGLQRFMWLAPISVMRNLGLLKMESVFWEGALIIWVDKETLTILSGRRMIKYEFPAIKMISSTNIDRQTRGDLLESIDDKMAKVRSNLAQARDHFPMPKSKRWNNHRAPFDNDLLS